MQQAKLGNRRVKHQGSKNRPRCEDKKHSIKENMKTYRPTYNVEGYRS